MRSFQSDIDIVRVFVEYIWVQQRWLFQILQSSQSIGLWQYWGYFIGLELNALVEIVNGLQVSFLLWQQFPTKQQSFIILRWLQNSYRKYLQSGFNIVYSLVWYCDEEEHILSIRIILKQHSVQILNALVILLQMEVTNTKQIHHLNIVTILVLQRLSKTFLSPNKIAILQLFLSFVQQR